MPDLPLFDPYKALEEIRRQRKSGGSQKLSPELSPPQARAISEQDQTLKPDFGNSSRSSHPGHACAHAAPPRPREERKKEKENSIISYTYAGDGGAVPEPGVSTPDTPARVARVARVGLSHSDDSEKVDLEAARVFGDRLREWRSGLSVLSPDRPPCPGYRADEWPAVLSRAFAFLDAFGPQAEALDWTASRLFGVHETAGIVRVDACGALVLPIGGEVRAITATEIRFGHLTHRQKPGQPAGVPWWEWRR